MPRIAFEMIGGPQWRGGYNYLLNLLTILGDRRPGAIEALLFVGTDLPPAELAPFSGLSGVSIIVDPLFDTGMRYRRMATALLKGCDTGAAVRFSAEGADLAFTNARLLGRGFPLPVLAWLPDFQHRRLPHLFSPAARWRRDFGYRRQMDEAAVILLSSDTAYRDAVADYAGIRNVHVARFAVPAPQTMDPAADRAVAEALGLPQRYFFLPNQFWTHKNHECAIAAAAILRQRFPEAVIATTGTADARAPDRMAKLQAMIDETGANVRMLGAQPYAKVASLLRASDALLNPSRFEGWSTTVEEAKAAGKPLVLSDLAVHREQAGETAAYFGVDDPARLAAILAERLAAPPVPAPALAELQAAASVRVEAFVDAFLGAVSATLAS
jgi:glycosyltransferase involved in cell wall biosynthesis